MRKLTFSIGGVHPNDSKLSKDCRIEVLPLPQTVYVSVAQHLGAPAVPVVAAGDKGTMVVKTFGCDGNIYRTGKMLEKLPSQIVETEAGPTRQFAPVPPGGIVTEPLPEIQTDWTDFYKNVADVLNGKAESVIKIPEVRRVLSVMEAAWKSAETGEAVLFE